MVIDARSLNESLEQQGYRLTAPRIRLLDAIVRVPGHFTAEDISAVTPSVGRATVFRTIKLLVELGAVCKIALADGTPRYRLASQSHHHHLICVRCGGSQDFARCDVDDVIARLQKATGYHVLGHRIEIYGVCSTCNMEAPDAVEGERWR